MNDTNLDSARLRPTSAFWLSIPVAAAVTWITHEFGHYQAGRALGYEMWMSINQAGPLEGGYASVEHGILIAMAGPLVTYLQALLALVLVRARRVSLAYPYLFLAFFMRAVAFAIGVSKPNDEAQASLDLGWPVWVLPTIAVTALLALTIVGSRTLRVSWRTNTGLYLSASAMAAAIVYGEPLIGRLIG